MTLRRPPRRAAATGMPTGSRSPRCGGETATRLDFALSPRLRGRRSLFHVPTPLETHRSRKSPKPPDNPSPRVPYRTWSTSRGRRMPPQAYEAGRPVHVVIGCRRGVPTFRDPRVAKVAFDPLVGNRSTLAATVMPTHIHWLLSDCTALPATVGRYKSHRHDLSPARPRWSILAAKLLGSRGPLEREARPDRPIRGREPDPCGVLSEVRGLPLRSRLSGAHRRPPLASPSAGVQPVAAALRGGRRSAMVPEKQSEHPSDSHPYSSRQHHADDGGDRAPPLQVGPVRPLDLRAHTHAVRPRRCARGRRR